MSEFSTKLIIFLLVFALSLILLTIVVYYTWNYVIVDIGGPSITFFQSFLLCFLGRALTGEIKVKS